MELIPVPVAETAGRFDEITDVLQVALHTPKCPRWAWCWANRHGRPTDAPDTATLSRSVEPGGEMAVCPGNCHTQRGDHSCKRRPAGTVCPLAVYGAVSGVLKCSGCLFKGGAAHLGLPGRGQPCVSVAVALEVSLPHHLAAPLPFLLLTSRSSHRGGLPLSTFEVPLSQGRSPCQGKSL